MTRIRRHDTAESRTGIDDPRRLVDSTAAARQSRYNRFKESTCMRILSSVLLLLLVGCATTTDANGRGVETGPLTRGDGYTHFLTAIIHQRSGRFEEASEHFLIAAKALPDSRDLHVKMTRFFILKQDFDNAASSCERALELDPGNALLWLTLGQIQEQRGDFDGSADAYRHVMELRPDNPNVYVQLIEAEQISNDLVAVVDVCKRLIEMRPDLAPLHLQLGMTLARMNDTHGAQESLVRALELQPDLTRARYILGILYLDQDEDEMAADQFRILLEAEPNNTRAREYLAGTAARRGRIDEAAVELGRIVAGADVEARHYIQYFYLLLAAERYQEAIEVVPPDAAPLFGTLLRAVARKGQGEPYEGLVESLDEVESDVDVECQEYLNDLLYLFGEDQTGAVFIDLLKAFQAEGIPSRTVGQLLGRVLIGLDRFDEAEGVLLEVIQTYGADKWTHFYLATIYEERDQFRPAEKHLKACLALDPQDPEVLNFLGYMYADQNTNLREAERLLKQALEYDPENGFYLDSLGWIYYQRGKSERAIELIRRAIVLMDNDDAILRDHLGDAYLQNGEPEKALKEWRRAIRLDPTVKGVQQKIDRHNP